MEESSMRRAAAGLQIPPPAWLVCVWMEWPPALKYIAYRHVSTSWRCLGSAAQCVLVSKFTWFLCLSHVLSFGVTLSCSFGRRLHIWGQSVRSRGQFPSCQWSLSDLHMWGRKLFGDVEVIIISIHPSSCDSIYFVLRWCLMDSNIWSVTGSSVPA